MSDRVAVGRVVKVHGLRGEVVVDSWSDVPDRFAAGVEVHAGDRVLRIASSRAHQGRLLVAFEGLADRTAAEALRGATLTAPPVDVSDSDTYYAHELVGMAVVLEDGTWVGDVVDLVEVPDVAGYDLLEVDTDGHRWLLPAADDLVEVVEWRSEPGVEWRSEPGVEWRSEPGDDADGVDVLCVVDPPPGLLPGTDHEAEVADGGA